MSVLIRFLADGTLVIILGSGALVLLTSVRDRLRVYPLIVMAALTSLFLAKTVSVLYQPSTARPFIEKGVAAGAAFVPNPGFPSDHALLATVIVLAVLMTTRHKKLAIVLAVLTLAMCAGRVLALVHTPLDVAGGIVLGLCGGVWYLTATPSSRRKS